MKIEEGAKIIVENWLQIKPHQYIIYICDETNKREAHVFSQAVRNAKAKCCIIQLNSQEIQSGKCFEELKWEMAEADAIVGATNYSFITTDAVNYALSKGVQFLSMPMLTNDGSSLLEQEFLKMDPDVSTLLGMPMFWQLRKSNHVHITTQLGTDFFLILQIDFLGFFMVHCGNLENVLHQALKFIFHPWNIELMGNWF